MKDPVTEQVCTGDGIITFSIENFLGVFLSREHLKHTYLSGFLGLDFKGHAT